MADEEPRNVKELLIEAKDASELMVDLAYAAVFFNDDDLAGEVEKLEQRMDGHLRRLRKLGREQSLLPVQPGQIGNRIEIALSSW
jgi:uncharacterized protein with PhoU and TrkA domain